MSDIKHKFTLVITVHEDLSFIAKILEYYRNAPFNIIIADSSRELGDYAENVPSNAKVVHEPGKFWYKKLHDIFNNIETPYVLDMADDDKIEIHAIEECVDFLETNSSFVGVSGKWDNRHVDFTASNDFATRILDNMGRWNPVPNHSVFRTNILQDCYKWVAENTDGFPIRWWDKFLSFYILFRGNYMKLDFDYGVSGPPKRMDNIKKLIPESDKLYYDKKWLDVFDNPDDNFSYPVSLIESMGVELEEAKKFVKSAFESFPR
tara:strand:- start:2763 stop:3551 length:789 start_codon:yes stop_codon:yes gene_type:complete